MRADWTQLAKEFQITLYEKIFTEQDYTDYIQATIQAVLAGKKQRPHLSQTPAPPLKQLPKTTPPHIQAARKYQTWTGQALKQGDWIDYVMTLNGAEPLGADEDFALLKSPIDYEFYLTKQLKPVADSILYFLGAKMQAGPAQLLLF